MSSVIAPAAEAHSPLVAARKNFAADLVLEIDICERLPVVIANHEARGLIFDGPRQREAADGHCYCLTEQQTIRIRKQAAARIIKNNRLTHFKRRVSKWDPRPGVARPGATPGEEVRTPGSTRWPLVQNSPLHAVPESAAAHPHKVYWCRLFARAQTR